jgi:hypothetical protein
MVFSEIEAVFEGLGWCHSEPVSVRPHVSTQRSMGAHLCRPLPGDTRPLSISDETDSRISTRRSVEILDVHFSTAQFKRAKDIISSSINAL